MRDLGGGTLTNSPGSVRKMVSCSAEGIPPAGMMLQNQQGNTQRAGPGFLVQPHSLLPLFPGHCLNRASGQAQMEFASPNSTRQSQEGWF